jgi:hypothetical protein
LTSLWARTRVASPSTTSSSTSGGRRRPTRGREHGPWRHGARPARRVLGNPLDHTPSSRGPGHRAEQLRLVTQHRQVAQAVATISQHDGQVSQHDRVGVAASATWGTPAQRAGQPDPIGQLTQQCRPSMPHDAAAVGGDFEAGTRVGSLHPQGALLEPVMRPSDSRILPAQRAPCVTGRRHPSYLDEKPRLGVILAWSAPHDLSINKSKVDLDHAQGGFYPTESAFPEPTERAGTASRTLAWLPFAVMSDTSRAAYCSRAKSR